MKSFPTGLVGELEAPESIDSAMEGGDASEMESPCRPRALPASLPNEVSWYKLGTAKSGSLYNFGKAVRGGLVLVRVGPTVPAGALRVK